MNDGDLRPGNSFDWWPLSTGPGGFPILWRRPLSGGRWQLRITTGADGGAKTMDMECDSRPVAVGWRPDRQAIAFLRLMPDGTFGLFAWEFWSGEAPRQLPVPRAQSGFQTLRWHPRRFEILCRADGRLVGTGPGGYRTYAASVLPLSEFRWHPDGERVGCVSAFAPGSILEAHPKEKAFRLREIVRRGRVSGWDWADEGDSLVAAARARGEEWFRIRTLGSDWGDANLALGGSDNADVHAPAVGRDGRVAWEIRGRGSSSVRLPDGRVVPDAALLDEAVGDFESTLVLRRYPPDRPPELWRWAAEDGLEILAAADTKSGPGGPVPEHIEIPGDRGARIPGWLRWPENPRGAVVEIHGGPRLAEGPRWQPGRDLLARNRIACFSINYSGSSGYGRNVEEAFDRDRAIGEIRIAARWLADRLPGDGNGVVLSGHCLGAALALEAGRPLHQGDVWRVVIAAPDPECLYRWKNRGEGHRAFLTAAFFGARDPFFNGGAAEEAWASLESVPEVRRKRIAGEGHTLLHPEGYEAYYRALLDALDHPGGAR